MQAFAFDGCQAADVQRLREVVPPMGQDRYLAPELTAAAALVASDALAEAALAQMQDSKITTLFAVREGRPVGILHIHDCLRAGMV